MWVKNMLKPSLASSLASDGVKINNYLAAEKAFNFINKFQFLRQKRFSKVDILSESFLIVVCVHSRNV